MAEPLPQLYDVTYTDADGEAISTKRFEKIHDPDLPRIEREMRFREVGETLGAADYSVRLMRSNEVRKLVREVRREELWREASRTMLKTIHFDMSEVTRTMVMMSRIDATANID